MDLSEAVNIYFNYTLTLCWKHRRTHLRLPMMDQILSYKMIFRNFYCCLNLKLGIFTSKLTERVLGLGAEFEVSQQQGQQSLVICKWVLNK